MAGVNRISCARHSAHLLDQQAAAKPVANNLTVPRFTTFIIRQRDSAFWNGQAFKTKATWIKAAAVVGLTDGPRASLQIQRIFYGSKAWIPNEYLVNDGPSMLALAAACNVSAS